MRIETTGGSGRRASRPATGTASAGRAPAAASSSTRDHGWRAPAGADATLPERPGGCRPVKRRCCRWAAAAAGIEIGVPGEMPETQAREAGPETAAMPQNTSRTNLLSDMSRQ